MFEKDEKIKKQDIHLSFEFIKISQNTVVFYQLSPNYACGNKQHNSPYIIFFPYKYMQNSNTATWVRDDCLLWRDFVCGGGRGGYYSVMNGRTGSRMHTTDWSVSSALSWSSTEIYIHKQTYCICCVDKIIGRFILSVF